MVHGADQGVLVRAAVTQGAERLRPGQFVEARLYQGTGGGAVRVPSAAVVRRADRDYLFVRHPDGFAAVPATVVAREGGQVVVRADLAADAAVVVHGTAALKAAWAGGAE
jgi:multidrug efflux pump subunit AcrA (membrane-fusion protein)